MELPFINYTGLHPDDRSVGLPTGILPIGFAANSLLFAAAWLLLIPAPAKLRRLYRTRHNRCPSCNYDLHATPPNSPCPECGTQNRLP